MAKSPNRQPFEPTSNDVYVGPRGLDDITRALHKEVQLADEAISPAYPVGASALRAPLGVADDWDRSRPVESHLATAFLRGRTVLRAISYGRMHWPLDYNVGAQIDREALASRPEGAIKMAVRLLQLTMLSRAEVYPHNDLWSLPRPEDMPGIRDEMRAELGVADAFQAATEGGDRIFQIPDFPGITDLDIVRAIADRRLRVGNPQQPTVVCWHG